LLIADTLSKAIPWDFYAAPAGMGAPELWLWLFAYGFSLYNDFAGYTAIVRGLSGLFGIDLSPNFRWPYFARTFTEFWNRWHITLSQWLRDYLFLPLSRGLLRRHPGRRSWLDWALPPIATMVVSGLWHGLSAHMIVWGLLHGGYLVAERAISLRRRSVPPDRWPLWRQAAGAGLVFLLVTLAWAPFRMPLAPTLELWSSLFTAFTLDVRYRRVALVIPLLLMAVGLDWLEQRREDELVFRQWPRLAQAAILAVLLFFVVLVSQRPEAAPFVYQGF
jgi:D-alanyl-lipoteichoic acid acyltransferase DltB (MBOAT superfamily)